MVQAEDWSVKTSSIVKKVEFLIAQSYKHLRTFRSEIVTIRAQKEICTGDFFRAVFQHLEIILKGFFERDMSHHSVGSLECMIILL